MDNLIMGEEIFEPEQECDSIINHITHRYATEAEISQLNAEAEISRYPNAVERLICARYSISKELAIHRQRDSKPQEFAEYNAYCEQCKLQAKLQQYEGC